MKTSTRRCLALSTLLATTIPAATPANAAKAATPRPLGANEVLIVSPRDASSGLPGLQAGSAPIAYQRIEWSPASAVTPPTRAKLEAAIGTLACAGKPKLSCTMTVDGKVQKVPTSRTNELFSEPGSPQVQGLIKIKLKRPPIIIIIGKPLTA